MRRNIFILACTSILFLTSCISQKTPDHTAYLFAYFEGSGELTTQEQLRFAVSADAVHWKALNGNRPVIPSDEISQTGGIRDPHLNIPEICLTSPVPLSHFSSLALQFPDRKSTRLNSSHIPLSRMPSSA